MAKFLYKLGKLAANNSKKIIGGSLLILLVIAIIAMNLGSNFSEDMSIPGSESEKALHLIKKEFPSNTSQVQLVFNAPENNTLDSEEINNVITDTLKVIKEKAKGKKPAKPHMRVVHSPSRDLMEQLKASLGTSKRKAS